tara:strand:- start:92 stop:193 length:102 start_codon:yes stop_codon:yes gene_type:complete
MLKAKAYVKQGKYLAGTSAFDAPVIPASSILFT